MRRVLFVLLLGLLCAVTAEAQQTNRSDRWLPAINAFEQSDKTNPPPRNAVLFIGSSSIRGWKTLAEDFPEHQVINRGFGGSQIEDSVAFAHRIVLPYRPRTVVFYAGDNDLAAGNTPQQVFNDFKAFVSKVHEALPQTKVVFIAIKPSPSRWHLNEKTLEANGLIERFCKSDRRLSFADVYTPMLGTDGSPKPNLFVKDNLHMNAEGYELWTAVVKPHLVPRKGVPVTRR
ncbi:MAG: SGNH/GDSL hydrolase family protein [Limisphaerales bacterium]